MPGFRQCYGHIIIRIHRQSMWHTFEWLGLPFGYQEQVIVRRNMMYTNAIKRQAFKAVSALGLYHSLHVRRGDYMVLDVFDKNGKLTLPPHIMYSCKTVALRNCSGY